MAIWAIIVFFSGLVALVFHLFNIFNWFIPFWGLILMIIALGMLSRIWQKEKEGEKEKLVQKLIDLEEELTKRKTE